MVPSAARADVYLPRAVGGALEIPPRLKPPFARRELHRGRTLISILLLLFMQGSLATTSITPQTNALLPAPTSWGSASFAACKLHLSLQQLRQREAAGLPPRHRTGGLGRKMHPSIFEAWVCVDQHECSNSSAPMDDWFCWVIDERIALPKERAPDQYVPWGQNGQLKLFRTDQWSQKTPPPLAFSASGSTTAASHATTPPTTETTTPPPLAFSASGSTTAASNATTPPTTETTAPLKGCVEWSTSRLNKCVSHTDCAYSGCGDAGYRSICTCSQCDFRMGDWGSWPANCSYTCMYGMGAGAGDMCGIVNQTTPESDIRLISAVGHVGSWASPHRACSPHLMCENTTAAVKWVATTWLRQGTSCVLSKDGETLFCTEGSIKAINTQNGETRWESSATDRYGQRTQFGTSPALHPDGSVLYVGEHDYQLFALHTVNGSIFWISDGWPMYHVYETPVTSPDGRLLICTNQGNIVALSTATGIMLWKIHQGFNQNSPPAVSSDSRFLYKLREGSEEGGEFQYPQFSVVRYPYPAVVKLDMATLSGQTTGTPVWVCDLPSGRYSAVITSPDDSKVFVFRRNFRVSAHDTRTGTELWAFTGGSGEIHFSKSGVPFLGVCDARAVYVGSSDGYVYGINSVDGSLRWRYFAGGYRDMPDGGFVGSLPVCSRDGSRVVVGTISSEVAVLNASTGDLLWKSVTGQYQWDVRTEQLFINEVKGYVSYSSSIMSAPIINQDNTRVYTYGQAFGSRALLSLDINSMS